MWAAAFRRCRRCWVVASLPGPPPPSPLLTYHPTRPNHHHHRYHYYCLASRQPSPPGADQRHVDGRLQPDRRPHHVRLAEHVPRPAPHTAHSTQRGQALWRTVACVMCALRVTTHNSLRAKILVVAHGLQQGAAHSPRHHVSVLLRRVHARCGHCTMGSPASPLALARPEHTGPRDAWQRSRTSSVARRSHHCTARLGSARLVTGTFILPYTHPDKHVTFMYVPPWRTAFIPPCTHPCVLYVPTCNAASCAWSRNRNQHYVMSPSCCSCVFRRRTAAPLLFARTQHTVLSASPP